MLTWDEIDMLNKRMNVMSLLKFLSDANLIPASGHLDQIDEVMSRIVVWFLHFYLKARLLP
jgi:hypothetical protein